MPHRIIKSLENSQCVVHPPTSICSPERLSEPQEETLRVEENSSVSLCRRRSAVVLILNRPRFFLRRGRQRRFGKQKTQPAEPLYLKPLGVGGLQSVGGRASVTHVLHRTYFSHCLFGSTGRSKADLFSL